MGAVTDVKRTVKATPFDWRALDYPDVAEPGQAMRLYPDDNLLQFACPGCGRCGAIPAAHPKPPNGNGATWDLVGGTLDDVTTLTLSPSIHCVGCCGWHGYLRNGVFESC